MPDLATLKTWLSEAETARHRLLIGAREVSIQHDNQQVTYQQASLEKLNAYIADLKAQIAGLGGGGAPRRALEFLL